MSSIGVRLKEERERLGFSQTAFAELAASSKKSQIDYEKDFTQPKAGYLAAIAQQGADVQYIVTGERSAQAMSDDERLLLDRYRASLVELRKAALRVLDSSELNAEGLAGWHENIRGPEYYK